MTPRPHAAIDTAVFGTEVMLHDRRSDLTHELNPSASAVWLLIDGRHTVDQIAAELADLFHAPQADVEAGVRQAMGQFEALGVLAGSLEPDVAPAIEFRPVAEPLCGRMVMARPPDP